MDAAEYQQRVAELRAEAQQWAGSQTNMRAAYFATWLDFYMGELERSRNNHADTLARWAESIERVAVHGR
jgi:hypothetical protein